MRFLRWMISGARRLTVYRKGPYEKMFVREGLRSLLFVGLVFGIGLLLDMAAHMITGNFGLVRLTAAWVLVGALLAGGLGAAAVLRCRREDLAFMKKATRLIFGVMYMGVLFFAFWEARISGGLYIYSIAVIVVGTMMNFPLRETAAYILLFDLCIVYFQYQSGLHLWDDNFLHPDRYIIFMTVIALGAAWQRHVAYLLRIRQRTSLQAIGETDPLTGLLNRRGMEDYIRRVAPSREICAALFDIDNFKMYNDTYGHAAGDACLIRVAAILKDMVKERRAIAVRYGGEELLLLFFGEEPQEVRRIVEQGMRKLWNMKLSSGDGATQPFLSMSCGVAVSQESIANNFAKLYELIAAADENLYKAKRTGKNRCVS